MAQTSSSRKATKSKSPRPVLDSLRKPNAPPGHPLTKAKPDEVARPAGRKAKHKRAPEIGDGDL